MASHPKPSAKNDSGEYAKFKNFMKRLVAVPSSEVKEKEKERRPKRPSASREAGAKS